MRRPIALLAAAFAINAQAAPASPASVETLFVAMRMQATIESLHAPMEQMMKQTLSQAASAQGTQLTPEQQRVMDTVPPRFMALMHEQLAWDKVRPLYVQVYCETFEQEEVDGLIAFYDSPTGHTLVEKTPLVMQKSLAISQSLIRTVMPRLMDMMKQAQAEAQAAH